MYEAVSNKLPHNDHIGQAQTLQACTSRNPELRAASAQCPAIELWIKNNDQNRQPDTLHVSITNAPPPTQHLLDPAELYLILVRQSRRLVLSLL